ncbi:matrixin family metalloprotease [bacterium]|nr:matrixin family metalloprotease [bacterium]MBU1024420.1 matrixin family metalloprotease [bacterium]
MNLKKTLPALVLTLALLATMGIAVAGYKRGNTNSSASASAKKFSLPANAVEISPGVFYLGKAISEGEILGGYAFIMYAENTNDVVAVSASEDQDTKSCYGFLSYDPEKKGTRGAIWKNIENYVVDTANTESLESSFIMDALEASIQKWEDAANVNILGGGTSGTVADSVRNSIGKVPSNANEIIFADIDDLLNVNPDLNDSIGVTIVWGTFDGAIEDQKIYEADIVFNTGDYDWADCTAGGVDCVSDGKMDFENVAIHELGHAIGLGDLYKDRCSTQTMYNYSAEGETNKRTLKLGDIAGINVLYGE